METILVRIFGIALPECTLKGEFQRLDVTAQLRLLHARCGRVCKVRFDGNGFAIIICPCGFSDTLTEPQLEHALAAVEFGANTDVECSSRTIFRHWTAVETPLD